MIPLLFTLAQAADCVQRPIPIQLLLPDTEDAAAWRRAIQGCDFQVSEREVEPWVRLTPDARGGVRIEWSVLDGGGQIVHQQTTQAMPVNPAGRREFVLYLDENLPLASARRTGPVLQAELGGFLSPVPGMGDAEEGRGGSVTGTTSVALSAGWRVDHEAATPAQATRVGLAAVGTVRVRPYQSMGSLFDGLQAHAVDLLLGLDLIPHASVVLGAEGGVSLQSWPKVDCSGVSSPEPDSLCDHGARLWTAQAGLSAGPRLRLSPTARVDLRARFSVDFNPPTLWNEDDALLPAWRAGLGLGVVWLPQRALEAR